VVDGDVFGQRLLREMRRGEGEVFEEWFVTLLFRVLLEAFDGVVRDVGGGVITAVRFHRRQIHIVIEMIFRREEAVVILQGIRVVEPGGQAVAIHVPLAGMIVAVSRRRNNRCRNNPCRPRR